MKLNSQILRSYGLWIIAGWSLVVAFDVSAQVALIVSLREGLMLLPNRQLIVLLVAVDVLFVIGFCAAAYGLARRRPWGRRLFIGLTVVHFGLLLMGLFLPGTIFSQQRQTPDQQWWLFGRYLASLVLPVWYVNLAQVRAQFVNSPDSD